MTCPISCSADDNGIKITFECEEKGQRVTKAFQEGLQIEHQNGKIKKLTGDMEVIFSASGNKYMLNIKVWNCRESETGHCIEVVATGGLMGEEPVMCRNF